ncbi:hypothetical protein ADK41_31555 [Streptomyces caelestis]|uniref:Uncharacterized protein n=1 Tax=Streptomyces caelestis TaxID=36816 RepID=A0A0M8QEM2_9ACTN|nr:hypothetical protein ADK41_31555 [Streptomyces caelestis]
MGRCPAQDLAFQLPLLLRFQQPGVLRPQSGRFLRLAPARVTASGHGSVVMPRSAATAAYVRFPVAAR